MVALSAPCLSVRPHQGLEEDARRFGEKAKVVAEQDARIFEAMTSCVAVVSDLKRLEMDQRQELERKLLGAEAAQDELEKELDEMEKQVDDLLRSNQRNGATVQRQDLERAAMGTLSKELQEQLDRMLEQIKHLVDFINAGYEKQLGREQHQQEIMATLNHHHQLIQWLTATSQEVEKDIAELEVSHRF